jgi:hypothetical protein
MLRGSTFYTTVTNEERMAVIAAMAREFSGTGYGYYCRNGHPFTIGECGMATQKSVCPECGEPVGGQNHQAVERVTHASDLDGSFLCTNGSALISLVDMFYGRCILFKRVHVWYGVPVSDWLPFASIY